MTALPSTEPGTFLRFSKCLERNRKEREESKEWKKEGQKKVQGICFFFLVVVPQLFIEVEFT